MYTYAKGASYSILLCMGDTFSENKKVFKLYKVI